MDHPGIVPVYDVGRARDGRCYVVSKYIRGEDLGQRLRGRGRLRPQEAAALVRQVASTLHHAHEEGLVHRDIKPANILLSELDQPYVADFGLALKTEDVQLASQVAGTPAYMSPEQVTGDVAHLDGRSDIFSLGVVYYELLVGARPFRGKSLASLLKEICSVTPKLPHRWDRGVPKTLSAICMKCLAKRPADRFQTGKQLADELHRWLTLQESARDKLEARFGPPPPKRFGVVSAIALGVLVGALAVHWICSTLQVPAESESKIARSPIPPTTLKTFVRSVPPPVKRRTPRRLNPRNGRDPLGKFDALNPIGKR